MIGTIKWFSADKGFGFLTDENGCEHYFNGRNHSTNENMLIKAKTYAKTYAKQKGNSLGVLRCSTNIVVSPISISRQFTPIYRQTFTFRLKPSMAH